MITLTLPRNIFSWPETVSALFFTLACSKTKLFECLFSIFMIVFSLLKKILFISREGKGGRKRGRETSVCGCPLHPLLGTWPAAKACALGTQTQGQIPILRLGIELVTLVCRPALDPLSHTSQGWFSAFKG